MSEIRNHEHALNTQRVKSYLRNSYIQIEIKWTLFIHYGINAESEETIHRSVTSKGHLDFILFEILHFIYTIKLNNKLI